MRFVSYDSFLYYAKTKEMIYKSVNLKGAVYEPKQNSFSLQSIPTRTSFANVGRIFYKVHSLSSDMFSIELSRKFVQSSVD